MTPAATKRTRSRFYDYRVIALAVATMFFSTWLAFRRPSEATATKDSKPRTTVESERDDWATPIEVSIRTKPAGAKVYIAPRAMRSGTPSATDFVDAGVSPVQINLSPGKYFVAAVADDGSFHEVIRTVPVARQLCGSFSHDGFARASDMPSMPGNTIFLPTIRLFPPKPQGMSLVKTSDKSMCRDFWIAPTVVPATTYRKTMRLNMMPKAKQSGAATHISYAAALDYAESVGSRLPFANEYFFIATNRRKTRYPWGDKWGRENRWPVSGPFPDDKVKADEGPPIVGLFSPPHEWSMNWMQAYSIDSYGVDSSARRVVVGGPPHVLTSGELGDLNNRGVVKSVADISAAKFSPHIGIRCVRSANPHINASDFRVYDRHKQQFGL